MSSITKISVAGALVAVVMLGTPSEAANASAQQVDFSNVAFAPSGGPTTIPAGAADFCRRNPLDCAPNQHVVLAETLTQSNWNQLIAVNDDVNQRVVPETDQDHYHVADYWTYPVDGYGDCEDYALEKQKELIERGWDRSALLMTVVRDEHGDGHAVLLVRTDRGDLVLDNQNGKILLWKDTPYQFVKRQSQADAGKWVGLNDDRPVITAAVK